MPQMVDLHNHTLYGVDDGAQTMDMCRQMLDAAYAVGIRTICLTPHYCPSAYIYTAEDAHARFEKVRAYAKEHLPDLTLCRGSEVFGYHEAIVALEAGKCLSLGTGRAVLVEFLPGVMYRDMRNGFLSFFAAGYEPILAHVERYDCLRQRPARVEELVKMQVGIQVNASTLVQRHHVILYHFVKRLLRAGLIDVVASDTHQVDDHRLADMKKAYRMVEREHGTAYATRLFCTNPERYLFP